jgi:hypothetical protein
MPGQKFSLGDGMPHNDIAGCRSAASGPAGRFSGNFPELLPADFSNYLVLIG